MRHVLVLLGAGLLVTATGAQTVIGQLPLDALGYTDAAVQIVEADGNPATLEVLAIRHSDGRYSVGRISPGTCAGPWFNPKAGIPVGLFAGVSVDQVGGRDVLLVKDFIGASVWALALEAPSC